MENNAITGFTIQKLICDKYCIIPNSNNAVNQFKVFDKKLKNQFAPLVDELFDVLNLTPIECTTFSLDNRGKQLPYNFILSDNSTLSIRTNIKGSKVAPRVIGQAGFDKLNEHFSKIYGSRLVTQKDIKKLVINKIDEILPAFFEYLFDADYIVWIYYDKDGFRFHLIKGDSEANIDYEKDSFSFTRNINEWNESTTLKYKNISIAEIQVHKNRTFKFRFIMKNILPLIISKANTTETLGITAEKVVCDIYGLDYPTSFFRRYSVDMQYQIEDVIKNAFMHLPKPIKHIGSDSGSRGGSSKSSYDFLLYGDKTLSLKTNIGQKVCPPEVGQPNDKTCYLYFKHLINEDHIDKTIFKEMVYNSVDKMIKIYLDHLFYSDYLLRIYLNSKEDYLRSGNAYEYQILEKNTGSRYKWDLNKFTYTKPNIDDWNESNTVYYDGVKLGEFQVHNNRNCFKFRFYFNNLLKILATK